MTDPPDPPATTATRPRLTTTRPRLLLNAQPFGFGPSAAIAVLAAELAPACDRLGYIGAGHTLDLQRTPPHHALHDTTGLPERDLLARLERLAPDYDLFVTAMDFEMAALARRAGWRVAIYDALTWYWPTIPAVANEATVYLAQDFFGVRERVASLPALRDHTVIVPPAIPPRLHREPGRHVLLNLGGLCNPFWRPDDAAAYARLMTTAARAAHPADQPLVIATSRDVADRLGDPAARTYDHDEVLHLMSTAAHAWMTPGLGNIYDAAATGVPTLWLPSANNTHPRQAHQLALHGYCDAHVDWADLALPVDYDQPDPTTSRELTRIVHHVSTTPRLRDRLTTLLAAHTTTLAATPTGRARPLTARFGHTGTHPAATALLHSATHAP
ncbi:hypothetical protein [Allostreptomyces psammosilenae]|uniref:Glycosyltransferase n=1 Tax=Allostreptomyces psammosilenae TaxID=1892865 RepID=A0A852ZZP4_9ACTN|nr:hypothetical protein [Allostreptomyces psammosilenae]NYI07307.1 hypothetical protein [Allostreptomyces psammosilenae]